MNGKLPPILMTPAFRYGKMTPWGGEGLRRFGKQIPDSKTGESLEVSVLPGLESRDETGRPLSGLLKAYGAAMSGTSVGEEFPLLLKLISSDDWLSVQVHPGDKYARMYEQGKLGKTEAWVILDAEPGAEIVYGIREGVTKDMLAEACGKGGEAIRACLRFVQVQAGDVFLIPAGTVHALGRGVTVAEIQQSSDVTYRFYDWDRVDAQGRSRELHIAKGLDVVNTGRQPEKCAGRPVGLGGAQGLRYADGPAFTLDRLSLRGEMRLGATPESFRLLMAMGDGELSWAEGSASLACGQSVFLPAQLTETVLTGELDVLVMAPATEQTGGA